MRRPTTLLVALLLIAMLALAACGSDDDDNGGNNGDTTDTSAAGPADFTISGDPAIDRTTEGAFAASDVTNERVSLLFFEAMDDLVISVDNIPYDQAPGSYTIGTAMDLDIPSAEVVDATTNFTTYSSTSGTLEITEWNDDTLSGSFEFTAEKEVDEGETPVTITVSGEFDAVDAPQPVE